MRVGRASGVAIAATLLISGAPPTGAATPTTAKVSSAAFASASERKDCGDARWSEENDGKVRARVTAIRMSCRQAKRTMVRYSKSGFDSPPGYECATFMQVDRRGNLYSCFDDDRNGRYALMSPVTTRA